MGGYIDETDILSLRLKLVNQAPGGRQGLDRFLVPNRVRDHLERFDAGVMEALQSLPLGLGQGACGMAAGVLERIKAQGRVFDRFNQGLGRLQITIRHPLVIDRTRPHLQLFEESRPFLPVGLDHCGSRGLSPGGS